MLEPMECMKVVPTPKVTSKKVRVWAGAPKEELSGDGWGEGRKRFLDIRPRLDNFDGVMESTHGYTHRRKKWINPRLPFFSTLFAPGARG